MPASHPCPVIETCYLRQSWTIWLLTWFLCEAIYEIRAMVLVIFAADVGSSGFRAAAAGRGGTRQLAHILGKLQRASLLATESDHGGECRAAETGLGLPGENDGKDRNDADRSRRHHVSERAGRQCYGGGYANSAAALEIHAHSGERGAGLLRHSQPRRGDPRR